MVPSMPGASPDVAHLHQALAKLSELRASTAKLWNAAAEGTSVHHGDEGKEKRFLGEALKVFGA